MKFLDLTLDTPAENLACDEALLDLCEEEGIEALRFWESRQHFVVVGYANKVESEVNVEECRRRGVPILRRCSGGGTVVQGPGCLNYNLTLRIPENGPLATVTGTNEFVMERNRAAMEKTLGVRVVVKGCTDLASSDPNRNPSLNLNPSSFLKEIEIKSTSKIMKPEMVWLKFSGNAQRRRRHALVFHGTILHAFDLTLIDTLLRFPSAQPDYRAGRQHAEFVQNISAPSALICESLQREWNAAELLTAIPRKRIAKLVRERYSQDDWNLRR